MKPTKIVLTRIPNPKSAIVGFATITFDDTLVVKNIKIINGEKGMFIGMPSTKGKDDKYYDDVFVIDGKKKGTPGNDFLNRLQAAVIARWKEGNKPTFEDQTKSDPINQSSDDLPF